MMDLKTWQARWGVPDAAIRELAAPPVLDPVEGAKAGSEAAVQALVRLEASRAGWRLWRNNRGAFKNPNGQWVRFGLANDSKQIGDKLKSGDLIGAKPHLVRVDDVGKTLPVFCNRETKPYGWVYNPNDEHEVAQMRWHLLVLAMGGDSAFATGTGTIK